MILYDNIAIYLQIHAKLRYTYVSSYCLISKGISILLLWQVPTMYTRLLQGYDNMDPDQQSACSYAAKQLRLMVSSSCSLKLSLQFGCISLNFVQSLTVTCYVQNCLKAQMYAIWFKESLMGMDPWILLLNLQGRMVSVAMLVQSTVLVETLN